jgi:hypothetical protein
MFPGGNTMNYRVVVFAAICLFSVVAAFAQVAQQDGSFQVRYVANLGFGDSFINITNTGANSTVAFPLQNGNICANVYAFSPDERLATCCTCFITPNGLASLSVVRDILSNTLTFPVPTSLVVKLLGSAGGTSPASCNAATVGTGTNLLVTGMAAWATTIHPLPVSPAMAPAYGFSETPFTNATLSAAELVRITTLCEFNQISGGGFGICRACRLGGLGPTKE